MKIKRFDKIQLIPKINIYSVSALLYFFAVLCTAVSGAAAVKLLYYISIGLCLLCAVKKRLFLNTKCCFLFFSLALLSILNYVFIHNLQLLNVVILLSSVFIAFVFLQKETLPGAFLAAFYCNVIYVLFSILTHGMRYEFYLESSSNYISIYLIAPIAIYYTLLDREKREPPLIHCVVLWIICFIGGSRMGFGASSILFIYVFFHVFLKKERKPIEKILFILALLFISFVVIIYLAPAFINKFANSRVIDRFINLGTSGEGRIDCWNEYIQSLKNPKYLFLGSDLSKLSWVIHYQGNLHNAYLFVHAYLGLFGITGLFVLLITDLIWGVKNKHYLYVACLLMFCVRGITDHMFGANRISVVLITLLIYPVIERKKSIIISDDLF